MKMTEMEIAKVVRERDKYKSLYENLSKRIGKIHTFAGRISSGGHTMMGGGGIDRDWVSRRLRRLAFGQGD